MNIVTTLRGVVVHFQKMEYPTNLFITDLIGEVQRRYRFLEAPNKAEGIDLEKGLHFALGIFEGTTIDALDVFADGLTARASAKTDVIDRFLTDLSEWASKTLHVSIQAAEPVAKGYLSTLEVSPSKDLAIWANGMTSLGQMLDAMLVVQGFAIAPYQTIGLAMHADKKTAWPLHPAKFLFERRIGQSYDDNVFFSEAPVPTSDHIKLLEQLENLL